MSESENELKTFDEKKFAYEMYRKEIEYRRDKAWKIFSWVSTIFLGVIGGLIALYSKPDNIPLLLGWNKIFLTVALLALTIYSCLWVQRNLDFEKRVFEKMVKLNLVETVESGKKYFGYKVTLILLSASAILSIWITSQ